MVLNWQTRPFKCVNFQGQLPNLVPALNIVASHHSLSFIKQLQSSNFDDLVLFIVSVRADLCGMLHTFHHHLYLKLSSTYM